MTPERWQEVKLLLAAALERPPEERRAYLDESCSDASMRREVESLIAAHEQGQSGFLLHAVETGEVLESGTKLGSYTIIGRIGIGGMGEVYEASDSKLGRKVAIKVLPPALMHGSAKLFRFQREAKLLASLNHPNICTIHDVGEHGGRHFIAMEFLDGQTLKARLINGPLLFDEVVELGVQIADALEVAHSHSIIHRDIKPANIFVTNRGQAKILDFGLAKQLPTAGSPGRSTAGEDSTQGEDLEFTVPGAAVGTVSYMSPEQALGQDVDAQTDIFSFGAVLYEMATGQRAFRGTTSAAVFDAILHKTPEWPPQSNSSLPDEFERIVNGALEKDRRRRYQSAFELRADLKRLQRETGSGQLSAKTRLGPRVTTHRWLRRNRRTAGICSFLLILIVAAAGYLWFGRTPPLTNKDSIILADFSNTTGDPAFDDALRQGLSVQLQQSPFLQMVSDDQVAQTLRMMEKPPGARLTNDMAREVCQRVNATAVIEGSIAAVGSQYVLGLEAVNCASGQIVAQEQAATNAKEKVLNVLGGAASDLRSKLGESRASLATYDVPLADATTPSLEALQAFTLGEAAAKKGDYAGAVSAFERAVSLDPNFASAYKSLAIEYSDLGEKALAAPTMKKAYDLRGHASDHEKLAITSEYYASGIGDLDKAAEASRLLVSTYPRDSQAHIQLGSLYLELGREEQAISELREAIQLDPTDSLAYGDLAEAYLEQGRFDEASATIGQAQLRRLNAPILQALLWWVAYLQNDPAGMAQYESAEREEAGPFGLDGILAIDQGRLGRLREVTANLVASAMEARQADRAAGAQADMAWTEALVGQTTEARRAALKVRAMSQDRDARGTAAVVLAISGDVAASEDLAADLSQRFPDATAVRYCYLPAVRAGLALHQGNPQEAIDGLSPVSRYDFLWRQGMMVTYLRGEAYLAAQQGAQAAAEFQKVLDHRYIAFASSLAHVQIARAYALQKDTARARSAYERFFALSKNADPDVPILRQAKLEYARLN
jgi:eukaryotic-like serine/threonine-protein kinase